MWGLGGVVHSELSSVDVQLKKKKEELLPHHLLPSPTTPSSVANATNHKQRHIN